MRQLRRPTIISIISPPFSGSTLITYLLATHPEVATIGERSKFYRKVIEPASKGSRYCSCGALFTECPVWSSVKSEVLNSIRFDRAVSLDFTNFQLYHSKTLNKLAHKICFRFAIRGYTRYLPYPLNDRFRQICHANAVLIDAILALKGASVFVDSSKNLVHTIYLDSMNKYDVRVIHLIRDGRAQVYSMLKRGWIGTIEEASRRWVQNISYQTKILEQVDIEIFSLCYEQLCASPSETISAVFEFAGLDPDLGSLKFRDFEQHIMGNWEMRSGNTTRIYDKQEWRSNLTQQQLKVFYEIAGETNRSLGYE